MSEEELGFDPTIMTAKGQQFIEIEREGTSERLILDGLISSSHHAPASTPNSAFLARSQST